MVALKRKVEPNALALRFALGSSLPQLRRAARNVLRDAFDSTDSTAGAARKLGIHRNTVTNLYREAGLPVKRRKPREVNPGA